jgi:hypothetical protein
MQSLPWYDLTWPRALWALFGVWIGCFAGVAALAVLAMSRDEKTADRPSISTMGEGRSGRVRRF